MRAILAWLAAILVMGIFAPAHAQTLVPAPGLVLPILAGERFTLDSAVIPGRQYHIHVRLPDGYGRNPDARYPVVYLLDGDSTLAMLAPLHLFMTYEDRVPEVIMVGIGYGSFGEGNHRGIDYRAPLDGVAPPAGGGAPMFARMLREELVPQIEARFRADPQHRILIGQSMGGQFLLWSAWNEPDAWWARIVSNASLRDAAPQFLQPPRALPPGDRHLIVASGTNDRPALRAEYLAFRQQWSRGQMLPWRLTMVDIPEGTHAADLGRAYRYAMRLLFPAPATVTP
jgi:uncharacterized protein